MNTLLRRTPTKSRAARSATRVVSGSPIGMSTATHAAPETPSTSAARSVPTITSRLAARPSTTATHPALYQSIPRTGRSLTAPMTAEGEGFEPSSEA
jgi:hypothetical protein